MYKSDGGIVYNLYIATHNALYCDLSEGLALIYRSTNKHIKRLKTDFRAFKGNE